MKIFIKTLEPLENRYTCQWKESIPNEIKQFFENKNYVVQIKNYEEFLKEENTINNDLNKKTIQIISIDGETNLVEKETKNGTFLNFLDTNYWKSTQLCKFIKLIKKGKLEPGDVVFLADAWDPTLLQLKYMIDLHINKTNKNNIKIIGLWHAGSYDPNDFLGRIKHKEWLQQLELSLFEAIDHNVYATKYHLNIFSSLFSQKSSTIKEYITDKEKFLNKLIESKKVVLSGQPHSLLVDQLEACDSSNKENIILFPHRISEEKQPYIFNDLEPFFPEYKFITCQKQNLSKDQYHKLLAKSKLVFSANLQETLGIAMMEGILTNNQIIIPDRLSYKEMYLDYFKYPSEWTENFNKYQFNRDKLIVFLKNKLADVETKNYLKYIEAQKNILKEKYLYMNKLLTELF